MPRSSKQKLMKDENGTSLEQDKRLPSLDPNDPEAMHRIAEQVAALNPEHERKILAWMELLQDFDKDWTPQE